MRIEIKSWLRKSPIQLYYFLFDAQNEHETKHDSVLVRPMQLLIKYPIGFSYRWRPEARIYVNNRFSKTNTHGRVLLLLLLLLLLFVYVNAGVHAYVMSYVYSVIDCVRTARWRIIMQSAWDCTLLLLHFGMKFNAMCGANGIHSKRPQLSNLNIKYTENRLP